MTIVLCMVAEWVQDLNSTSASISCETFRFPVRLTLHFLSPYHQDTTFRNVPIQ